MSEKIETLPVQTLPKEIKSLSYIPEILDIFNSNEISEVNKNIIKEYFKKMLVKKLANSTIVYNVKIMKFFLDNVGADLDKLTKYDTSDFETAILTWCREDRSEVAATTKKQYMIGFKRFLHWYGRFENRRDYLDLADNMENIKASGVSKLPSDLLTKDEILKMIDTAEYTQDKAFIAALAESGCRIGELLSCRIKDVERVPDGIRLTFPRSKTISRTVLLAYMSSYIIRWLDKHPMRNDLNAPLWVTKRKQNVSKIEGVKKLEYKAITYNTALAILKRIADSAKINKHIHPHLFRHSRATVLSRDMSESQLRSYFGWKPGSTVPSLYIHLSSEDTESAIRELYGLVDKTKTERGFEVGKCPRCSTIIPIDATYCYACSHPLTKETEQNMTAKMKEMISIISKYPDMLAGVLEKAQN